MILEKTVSIKDTIKILGICTIFITISEILSWLWFKIDFLPRSIVALGDIPFNILASILAIIPLSLIFLKTSLNFYVVWAGMLTFVIDLDHFVVARSFSLMDALSLPQRPITHSFIIILFFSTFLSIITRSKGIGIISFFALCAHLLRDAPTCENFLYYPISSDTCNLSYSLCLALIVLLPAVTLIAGYLFMKSDLLNFWFTETDGASWFNSSIESCSKFMAKFIRFD